MTDQTEASFGLIEANDIQEMQLFQKKGALDSVLKDIHDQVQPLVFDISTDAGRKECKSVAYNIARSKTAIDAVGKDLVSGWKAQAKEVDNMRKEAREYLQNLQNEVRMPVTGWEEEQERIALEEARLAEAQAAEEEAHQMNNLFDRESKLREEEERVARKAAEQAEQERIREATKEAERRAKEQAELEVHRANERAERAERRAQVEAQRAVQEERERAERKAAQERAEAERLEEEDRKRREDKQHRQNVNRAALESLIMFGVEEYAAKLVIGLIAKNRVPQIKMEY